MSYLWNPSTTIRNSHRIPDFLSTAQEIEGRQWNYDTMIEYQARLIKNRYYSPNKYHPLMNKGILTLDDALTIFNYQHYVDPPMRGRTSLSPLRKLGLVEINHNNEVHLTNSGRYFIQHPGDITTYMLEWKFQECADIRPFVAVIKFIYELDHHYESRNGVSHSEFGYYIMTLSNYHDIYSRVQRLIDVRSGDEPALTYHYLSSNFYNYNNYDDYLDNNLRYLSQSSIIDISHNKVRLNYDNEDVILSIINTYNGSASQSIY